MTFALIVLAIMFPMIALFKADQISALGIAMNIKEIIYGVSIFMYILFLILAYCSYKINKLEKALKKKDSEEEKKSPSEGD